MQASAQYVDMTLQAITFANVMLVFCIFRGRLIAVCTPTGSNNNWQQQQLAAAPPPHTRDRVSYGARARLLVMSADVHVVTSTRRRDDDEVLLQYFYRIQTANELCFIAAKGLVA